MMKNDSTEKITFEKVLKIFGFLDENIFMSRESLVLNFKFHICPFLIHK